jgi:hypothetical protein
MLMMNNPLYFTPEGFIASILLGIANLDDSK